MQVFILMWCAKLSKRGSSATFTQSFFPTKCHSLHVYFPEASCARTAFVFLLSPRTFSLERPSVFPPPTQYALPHVSVFPSLRPRAWQASIPGSSGPSKETKINENILILFNLIIPHYPNVVTFTINRKTWETNYY